MDDSWIVSPKLLVGAVVVMKLFFEKCILDASFLTLLFLNVYLVM